MQDTPLDSLPVDDRKSISYDMGGMEAGKLLDRAERQGQIFSGSLDLFVAAAATTGPMNRPGIGLIFAVLGVAAAVYGEYKAQSTAQAVAAYIKPFGKDSPAARFFAPYGIDIAKSVRRAAQRMTVLGLVQSTNGCVAMYGAFKALDSHSVPVRVAGAAAFIASAGLSVPVSAGLRSTRETLDRGLRNARALLRGDPVEVPAKKPSFLARRNNKPASAPLV